MGDFTESQNPYIILGLEKGFESTDAEIRKAYRKLALTKHPDKQPNNPNAAAEFAIIQKAYEVLLDSAARDAWNQLAKVKKAREERHAGASLKRRKMADDLDRRERASQTERNEEQIARQRLHAELERLKRQHAEREAQVNAERVAAAAAASVSSQGPVPSGATQPSPASHTGPVPDQEPPRMTEELLRSLKVSWDAKDGSYTAEELRQVFSAHGPVSDVVIRQSKKKSKGSAFVEMGTLEAAAAAAGAHNGRSELPLLVVPFSKVATVDDGLRRTPPASPGHAVPGPTTNGSRALPGAGPRVVQQLPNARPPAGGKPAFASFPSSFPAQPSQQLPRQGTSSRSSFSSFSASSFPGVPGPAPVFGSGNSTFENATLQKMRQRAERERLIAEMKAKGELGDDD